MGKSAGPRVERKPSVESTEKLPNPECATGISAKTSPRKRGLAKSRAGQLHFGRCTEPAGKKRNAKFFRFRGTMCKQRKGERALKGPVGGAITALRRSIAEK